MGTSKDKIWSVFSPKNHRGAGDEKAYEARQNYSEYSEMRAMEG